MYMGGGGFKYADNDLPSNIISLNVPAPIEDKYGDKKGQLL
jgi:hypothetical protein